MIRTIKGELLAECNECGHEEYGGTLEFKPFVAELKDQGWKVTKEDNEWIHALIAQTIAKHLTTIVVRTKHGKRN